MPNEIHQILPGHRTIIVALEVLLYFKYETTVTETQLESKIEAEFCTF